MTVAACLIVKNEAQVIRRCLDSLRGLVQAVVIVDTGSTDEVFYSLHRLGVFRLAEGDGLLMLLEAWQRCPHRWEPVHEACRWLNQRGLYQASYALSKQALASPPAPAGLFVLPDVYDHLLLFEHSISAYYVGRDQESLDVCRALLDKRLPRYLEEAVRRNIIFPQQRLGH